MRRTFVIATALSLVLVAGLAAVAEARGPRDNERPMQEYREMRREAVKAHFYPGNATLQLSGTATDRQNDTYSFTVDGAGKALDRYKNGTMEGFRGVVKAHVTLTAANGTVLKDGDIFLKVMGHQNKTGDWRFLVVSFKEKRDGMPRLVIRGEATPSGAGSFDLSGKGHAVVRLPNDRDGMSARPLKLSDVTGTLTVPVRP